MVREVRARFSGGVIEPLEHIDLEEGEEVTIVISKRPKGKEIRKALQATAGGWKGLVDTERLKRDVHADRLINTRPEPRL